MKIVFLSKRRPQGRDLLERPYGRFFHIPKLLADKGHSVHLVLADYENDAYVERRRDGINWYSLSAYPWSPKYYRFVRTLISNTKPDWVVAFSDTWYGVAAAFCARGSSTKVAVDAYDNYESYIPWAFPLHMLWRYSLARADRVIAAGPALLQLMVPGRRHGVAVVPMAADDLFAPLKKVHAREKLGLPSDKKLIGYCGSAVKSRGIERLLPVMEKLQTERADVEFVLSGRKDDDVSFPENVTHLGYLADEMMPYLINSLDLAIALNQRTSFGDYSYPVKVYEAVACKVPVLVSRTKATEWMFAGTTEVLFNLDAQNELFNKIIQRLDSGAADSLVFDAWPKIAEVFETCLLQSDSSSF